MFWRCSLSTILLDIYENSNICKTIRSTWKPCRILSFDFYVCKYFGHLFSSLRYSPSNKIEKLWRQALEQYAFSQTFVFICYLRIVRLPVSWNNKTNSISISRSGMLIYIQFILITPTLHTHTHIPFHSVGSFGSHQISSIPIPMEITEMKYSILIIITIKRNKSDNKSFTGQFWMVHHTYRRR